MNITNTNSGFIIKMFSNLTSNSPSWDNRKITYKIDTLNTENQLGIAIQITENAFVKIESVNLSFGADSVKLDLLNLLESLVLVKKDRRFVDDNIFIGNSKKTVEAAKAFIDK